MHTTKFHNYWQFTFETFWVRDLEQRHSLKEPVVSLDVNIFFLY